MTPPHDEPRHQAYPNLYCFKPPLYNSPTRTTADEVQIILEESHLLYWRESHLQSANAMHRLLLLLTLAQLRLLSLGTCVHLLTMSAQPMQKTTG